MLAPPVAPPLHPLRSVPALVWLSFAACVSCAAPPRTDPKLVSPPTAGPPAPSATAEKPPPNEDSRAADPSLGPGTVVVEVLDEDDKPARDQSVLLAQISRTPAPDVTGVTDAHGHVTLSAPSWIGTSARVVGMRASARFLTSPFLVPAGGGMRVVVHTYPTSSDIADASVVFQSGVLVEREGAELVVTEVLAAYNFSKVAWLPDHVPFELPQGFSHFESTVYGDTSLGLRVEDGSALLFGTVVPGTSHFTMSWRLPLRGDRATIPVPSPPHLGFLRVVVLAEEGTDVSIPGFPAPVSETTAWGQPSLTTERKVKRTEPLPGVVNVSVRAVDVRRGRS